MLGVFSEFERAMIRDRVMAGLDRARAAGKRLGRPRSRLICIAESTMIRITGSANA